MTLGELAGVQLVRSGRRLVTMTNSVEATGDKATIVRNAHTLVGVGQWPPFLGGLVRAGFGKVVGYSTVSRLVAQTTSTPSSCLIIRKACFETYTELAPSGDDVLTGGLDGDPIHLLFMPIIAHALSVGEQVAELDGESIAVTEVSAYSSILVRVLTEVFGLDCTVTKAADEKPLSSLCICTSCANDEDGVVPVDWRRLASSDRFGALLSESSTLLATGGLSVDGLVIDHLHADSIDDLDSPYWDLVAGSYVVYDW